MHDSNQTAISLEQTRTCAPQREGEAAVFKTFVRVLGEMRATQRAAEPMHTEKAKS